MLPTQSLRLFVKHYLEIAQGFYNAEIRGALTNMPADKFTVEKFLATTRVEQRFAKPFQIAYDSIAGNPQEDKGKDEEGGKGEDETTQKEGAESASSGGKQDQQDKQKQESKGAKWRLFEVTARLFVLESWKGGWFY